MEAWISLVSHFSEELLIFELLAFFALLAGFFLLVIARKRRYPGASVVVPVQVFQESIDQLIGEAESLREQLFGTNTDPRAPRATQAQTIVETATPIVTATAIPTISNVNDPKLIAEAETLRAQVVQLKAENASLIQKAATAPTVTGTTSQDMISNAMKAAEASGDTDLIQKIRALEERLEEYSVIEDDLANLKRLQQENAQLRAQLGSAPTTEAATKEPVVEEPVVEELAAAAEEPAADDEEPVAAEAPSGASTQPSTAVAAAPATEPTTELTVDTPPEVIATGGGDEDLLAEFEKILNS